MFEKSPRRKNHLGVEGCDVFVFAPRQTRSNSKQSPPKLPAGRRKARDEHGWPQRQLASLPGVCTYIQRRSRAEASPSSRPCTPRSHFPRKKNRSLTFDGSRLGYSGQRVTLFFHGSSLGSLSPAAISRQPTLSYTAEQAEEQRHQR